MIRSSDTAEVARSRLIDVFVYQPQADYILEMRLRRLTKFSTHRARQGSPSSSAPSRSSTRSSVTRRCCRRSSPTSSPRSPRPSAPPAAPSCWSRPGPGRGVRRPARGRRRPVLRAAVRHGACWPAPPARAVRVRRGPRQRTTWWCRPSRPRCAARSACSPRPDASPAQRARPARPAAERQRPQPAGGSRWPRCCSWPPASGRWRCAPWPPTGRAWSSAPATGSSSGSTPRCSAATSGRSSAQRRRRGGRGRRARHRRGDAVLHHLGRPAAALRRSCPSAGPLGRRHGRRQARPRRASGLVRRRRPRRREGSVVVTVSGSSTALPGTEPGTVKVTAFTETPPRVAPPAACAATASSRARTPWSSPGPDRAGPGGRRQRRAGPAARRPTVAATAPGSPASQPVAPCAGPRRSGSAPPGPPPGPPPM